MSILSSLEEQVIRMLLAGDDDALGVLRQQMGRAHISSRRLTGAGFYTEFSIPSEAARLGGRVSFKLGDVNGTAANIKHGLGFLLYVTDGALAMLEGYTYDDPWPDKVEGLVLVYSGGKNHDRNMNKVRQIVHPK